MVRVTLINHATVLIELNGIRVLTDPVYSFSVSYFLPRLKKPGISFEQLPPIDVVGISHDHYDHLNLRTLRRISRDHRASILFPRGLGSYGKRTGFAEIVELEWWETLEVRGLTITCVPAKHFSGRKPWGRNRTKPSGYVFQSGGESVYFAGDTAYDAVTFRELRRRFSLDIALLPIGAYKPHAWFKNIHLNPPDALQAFIDTGATMMIPIHWGTFKISDEPMSEPPEWLMNEAKTRGVDGRVKVVGNGESVRVRG
jgi:L-ascorbate metabolism protein UlaG (beta-lactamase superfamily)